MRQIKKLNLLVMCGLIMATAMPLRAAEEALCYAAADRPNNLVSSWRTGGGFIDTAFSARHLRA